jgi:ribosome biogenesis protein MAK21
MPKIAGDNDLLDDSSDDVPSGLDDDSEVGDEGARSADDDDVLSLVEGSDNEDLLPLNGLLTYNGSDAEDPEEDEEWGGISVPDDGDKKRKRGGDGAREKRKKLRSLPTFASYEEYAKMIEDGPEDNI